MTASSVLTRDAGLDAAQLERKIRLLSLADLGFQNIGQDLPYAQVATVLQVNPSEVERWVIDGSFSFPFLLRSQFANTDRFLCFLTMHSDQSRSAYGQARAARADVTRDTRHGPRVWPAGMGAVSQASR